MLSGGGQWGAFGAGYLDQARRNGTLPEFSYVSGVSTGALQSLFVSIGTPDAYAMLLDAYAPK
jgi:predicted patatin/cPLA2 family phospholipase